jgi:hypothetical protein
VTTTGTTSPITGVSVSCQGTTSTTGSDGRYTLNNLVAGTATLQASRSGYEPYTQTINLAPGNNTHNIALSQSTSGTTVTGSVSGLYPIDGQTYPLPGALVTIAGKTDTTDSAGRFQLPTIPEGNQTVTVSLPGWAAYSQNFFISSTNRTLTLALSYNGPNLRGSSIEWRSLQGCNRFTRTLYQHILVGQLAALTGNLTISQESALEIEYEATITVNGRPAASTSDPVRRGWLGTSAQCPGGFPCDDPLTLPGSRGTLRTIARGSYNRIPMDLSYLTWKGTHSDPDVEHYYAVYIALWSTESPCPSVTSQTTDVGIQYRGTITLHYTGTGNRWTTTTIPFQSPDFKFDLGLIN